MGVHLGAPTTIKYSPLILPANEITGEKTCKDDKKYNNKISERIENYVKLVNPNNKYLNNSGSLNYIYDNDYLLNKHNII